MKPIARVPNLFIGPWVGEFGVELLRWQSIARALAKSRIWDEIIVATHPDRFFMYEDFATKFVPVRPPSIHTLGYRCDGYTQDDLHRAYIDVLRGDVLFSPHLEVPSENVFYPLSACRSTYRNFSIDAALPQIGYNILIHARATPKANQHFKNWPVRNYEALVEGLPATLKIASVGAKDGAHKIRGTDDLRGVPLGELAGHCRNASVMIGPSSGAIHFAMHCGTPVITWIGHEERCNYFSQWNPQNVPFACVSGWQPAPSTILHKLHSLLSLSESRRFPIECLIVGSRKNGQNDFLEWMAELSPETHMVHWNNCVRTGSVSPPDEDYFLPCNECTPKDIHRNDDTEFLSRWHSHSQTKARILSFTEPNLTEIASLHEAHEAKRIIILIRDIPNTVADAKQNLTEFKECPFLHSKFFGLVDTCRSYLNEASGKTSQLGELRTKTLFVSYNRWKHDPPYRREIAASLGKGYRDSWTTDLDTRQANGDVSHYKLANASPEHNNLWKNYLHVHDFWNLVCNDDLFEMEKALHGRFYPDFDILNTI